MIMEPKLYVLIREDLPDMAYKAVQGGHAVAQYVNEYGWKNDTLIYAEVSPYSMRKWMSKLDSRYAPYSKFVEPDWNEQITAIAFEGWDVLIPLVKRLKLMKGY